MKFRPAFTRIEEALTSVSNIGTGFCQSTPECCATPALANTGDPRRTSRFKAGLPEILAQRLQYGT